MRVIVGFDGFIDEIYSVVLRRRSPDHFERMETITEFGESILACAGVSGNFELVCQRRKIGGNAPILAEALVALGHAPVLMGALGESGLDPLFAPLEQGCSLVYTLAASGHTAALEFSDGKLLLGEMSSLYSITPEHLVRVVGRERLITLFEGADLFVSANWTMLLSMHAIWCYLLEEIVPHLTVKQRFLFVDLADPRKRPQKDLKEAMQLLKQWQKHFDVVLGLNQSEVECVSQSLGVMGSHGQLREALGIAQLLIHTKTFVSVNTPLQEIKQSVVYDPDPKISTGVGDHFNAGYCHGLLEKWPLEHCLQKAREVALHYLQNGS